ncbi:homing endonuclease, partial [Coemansia reversa NRRL 1564]
WLVGFINAEGMFRISNPYFSSDHIQTSLIFQIKLHKDELPLLQWMQNNLFNGGSIRKDDNKVAFIIKKQVIIENILIPIFERFPLNTKKYLDYQDWIKAFPLFKLQSYKEVNNQKFIKSLIMNMNSRR